MKVSWDDEIPNIWKVIKFMFQTTNQSKLGPKMFKNQDVRLRALQAPEGIHHIFRAETDEATATYSRCPLHG